MIWVIVVVVVLVAVAGEIIWNDNKPFRKATDKVVKGVEPYELPRIVELNQGYGLIRVSTRAYRQYGCGHTYGDYGWSMATAATLILKYGCVGRFHDRLVVIDDSLGLNEVGFSRHAPKGLVRAAKNHRLIW